MTCYEIARKIMDKIREQDDYRECSHTVSNGVKYYDAPESSEFFYLAYNDVEIHVYRGMVEWIQIPNPRGITLFNLRLWLMEVDKTVK